MSIKGRTDLKSEFEHGKAATAEKFEDLIDSSFNRYEDSILAGPIGMTGTLGLWLSESIAPTGSTSTGTPGEFIVSGTAVYICHALNSWIKISGETQF